MATAIGYSKSHLEGWVERGFTHPSFFFLPVWYFENLERFLYESDFVSVLLLQFNVGRNARLLSYFDASRYKMAVAFLAISKSNQARSSILIMKLSLFMLDYCRLLLGVMSGRRETPYPLGVVWRWRHKRYRDL